MISIDFCEKMSHATTRLDVFRRAVVSTPAIFFPRKPEPCSELSHFVDFLCFLARLRGGFELWPSLVP